MARVYDDADRPFGVFEAGAAQQQLIECKRQRFAVVQSELSVKLAELAIWRLAFDRRAETFEFFVAGEIGDRLWRLSGFEICLAVET